MATFQITGPDGKKYRVKGETPDGAMAALKKMIGSAPKPVTVDPATNQPQGVPEFVPPGVKGYDPQTGEVRPQVGMGSAAGLGAADTATFGFGDELASVAGSLISGRPREEVLAEMRGLQTAAQEQNPGSYLAGQIGGAVAGGGALAKGGLSLGANAAARGASLGRVAMGGAADGAILGGAHGIGSGTDAQSRAVGGGIGSVAGGVLGGAAPYAIAGAATALKPLTAPIMARLRPEDYAQKALIEGLKRSGATPQQITQALKNARKDGQGVFTVADAMGNSGQRMLSTAARNPHEGRQALVEGLQARQMGQGDRLSNALAEGFNAPDTAAQRAASLKAGRDTLANVNYGNARQGAGPVDVSGALREIDDILQPGVHKLANPGSGIADDSLESVVRRAQSLLTDGKSVATNFDAVLRAKQDIADVIGTAQRSGKNNQVRLLSQINQRLDEALEKASPAYRQANDAFRAQSKTIDAVEAGKAATSGRTRAADNIAQFQSMPRGEQNAFRAGYADPLIAKVESSSISPTTNKARPLMSDKTAAEFPAIAIPQRADKMGRRIAREQRMFETANAALGGSKTADNLADAADLNKFDPSIMTNLLQGRPIAAVVSALTKALNEAKGMPPSVLTQLSRALMETDPAVASQLLAAGSNRALNGAQQRALFSEILTSLNASGAGRLAAQ